MASGGVEVFSAETAGQLKFSAERVNYIRLEPTTGATPAMRLSAAWAASSPDGILFRDVSFSGRGALDVEVVAAAGRLEQQGGASLWGGVRASWSGEGFTAQFHSEILAWDERTRMLSTSSEVAGYLSGREAAEPQGLRLMISGVGLEASHHDGFIRIMRDATLELSGPIGGVWLARSDGGLEIQGLGGPRPVLRLKGPVSASSKDSSVEADAVELQLRVEKGVLDLSQVYAVGMVDLNIGAGIGPSRGGVRVRAGAVECFPAESRAVFLGTPGEAVRLTSQSGEICGLRIEIGLSPEDR